MTITLDCMSAQLMRCGEYRYNVLKVATLVASNANEAMLTSVLRSDGVWV